VRYRVITEAEHQLIRSRRDRADAYLLGGSTAAGAPAAGAAADGAAAAADKPAKSGKAVSISVTIGGAAAVAADAGAENVDVVMAVSGENAAKVGHVALQARSSWHGCHDSKAAAATSAEH